MPKKCRNCDISNLCILNGHPEPCLLDKGDAKEYLAYEFRERIIKELTERRLRNANRK